jgi:hypothetical protein
MADPSAGEVAAEVESDESPPEQAPSASVSGRATATANVVLLVMSFMVMRILPSVRVLCGYAERIAIWDGRVEY